MKPIKHNDQNQLFYVQIMRLLSTLKQKRKNYKTIKSTLRYSGTFLFRMFSHHVNDYLGICLRTR